MRLWLVVLAVSGLAVSLHAAEVRLTVEEPSGVRRDAWPVTSGIPLAQGALTDAEAAALVAGDGSEVPLQTRTLARWADGSIRWLLLDFQASLAPHEKQQYRLRFGPGIRRGEVERPVRVQSREGRVTVNTGPAEYIFATDAFRLLDHVRLDLDGDGQLSDDERVTAAEGAGIELATPDGGVFLADASPATAVVEESGPLRACVRFDGEHGSAEGKLFRYIVRVHAFRGQPAVRVHYTFINDSQDRVMTALDSLDLHVALADADPSGENVIDGRPVKQARLFQADENRCELDGQPAGARSQGWAAISNGRCGVAVGVREFWQNWPKGMTVEPGRLTVGICPAFDDGRYDGRPLREEVKLYYYLRDGVYTFKTGVARTHEIWAWPFTGQPDRQRLAEVFRAKEEPLLAVCEPEYVCTIQAAGDFPPADPARYDGYDAWLDRALEGHLRRRDAEREYGLLNYGDWFGEREVNWGNLEYDLAHGLFLQYLRTGDRRFFHRAEQAARHHIDVDVVHATNPHLKNSSVGQMWLHCCGHTGGYFDTDELPVERAYQQGYSTNFGHVWVAGDLDYYYLTGDNRAWDVSLAIADAMARHCPTSHGTHIRTLGWPMILLMAAYEATLDPKYLKAVEEEWKVLKGAIDWERGWVVRLASDHCLHPQGSTREQRDTIYRDQRCSGNVPFMEGLTLCGLARYHRMTGDPEVLRAISVGIDQMIRECWQEDVKTFRYTACPLSAKFSGGFILSVEALAYEAQLTGNPEHTRILQEGFRTAVSSANDSGFGKSLAQQIHFAPYGLKALAEPDRATRPRGGEPSP